MVLPLVSRVGYLTASAFGGEPTPPSRLSGLAVSRNSYTPSAEQFDERAVHHAVVRRATRWRRLVGIHPARAGVDREGFQATVVGRAEGDLVGPQPGQHVLGLVQAG